MAALVDQNTGKVLKHKSGNPGLPSSTTVCGMTKGGQWKPGHIEQAIEKGHTYGCMFDYELEQYKDKRGEDRKYHSITFSSHGPNDTFISEFLKDL